MSDLSVASFPTAGGAAAYYNALMLRKRSLALETAARTQQVPTLDPGLSFGQAVQDSATPRMSDIPKQAKPVDTTSVSPPAAAPVDRPVEVATRAAALLSDMTAADVPPAPPAAGEPAAGTTAASGWFALSPGKQLAAVIGGSVLLLLLAGAFATRSAATQ